MSRRLPSVAALGLLGALIAFAAFLTLDAADAQSGSRELRIAARKSANGRVELCIQPTGESARRCPTRRFFPYNDALPGIWRQSSPLTIDDADLVVRARRDGDRWIELELSVQLDDESQIIRPERRFYNYPQSPVGSWRRSSTISVDTVAPPPGIGIANDADRPALGKPAGVFTLAQLEGGGVHTLSDFRGQTLIVVFWASWNEASINLLQMLDQLRREQGEGRNELAVLAVNVYDTIGAASRAYVEAALALPSVIDRDGAIAELYRIDLLPELLVIDAEGVYRERLAGTPDPEAITAALHRAGGALP